MCNAKEAEEVLKEPDSLGSPEPTVVQSRMDKLKVLLSICPCKNTADFLDLAWNLLIYFISHFISQLHLLKLSSLSPDLERINELLYRLPVSDQDVKQLQSLNRAWASHCAHLTERFRYGDSKCLFHLCTFCFIENLLDSIESVSFCFST